MIGIFIKESTKDFGTSFTRNITFFKWVRWNLSSNPEKVQGICQSPEQKKLHNRITGGNVYCKNAKDKACLFNECFPCSFDANDYVVPDTPTFRNDILS